MADLKVSGLKTVCAYLLVFSMPKRSPSVYCAPQGGFVQPEFAHNIEFSCRPASDDLRRFDGLHPSQQAALRRTTATICYAQSGYNRCPDVRLRMDSSVGLLS